MSSGVLTVNEDGIIMTCNAAGRRILRVSENILNRSAAEFFVGANAWIPERLRHVEERRTGSVTMDAAMEFSGEKVSANVTILPLSDIQKRHSGSMIMLEDITAEKRMKSTLSRYMDPSVVE